MWRKSSYSSGGGNCVELNLGAHQVQVRDSKNPDGPILVFPRVDWRSVIRSRG
ncbi:DUF397 domain-containing protein [Actinosynnema sp. NPDC020468]|uniref:DUF397 domain-containing protein n=1 Tax=Actinosynnema sp. NPDC020468 TaxID=3154488 RepID=UPI00340F7B2F